MAMIDPENLDNIELLNEMKNDYEKLQEELNDLYLQWEELML